MTTEMAIISQLLLLQCWPSCHFQQPRTDDELTAITIWAISSSWAYFAKPSVRVVGRDTRLHLLYTMNGLITPPHVSSTPVLVEPLLAKVAQKYHLNNIRWLPGTHLPTQTHLILIFLDIGFQFPPSTATRQHHLRDHTLPMRRDLSCIPIVTPQQSRIVAQVNHSR